MAKIVCHNSIKHGKNNGLSLFLVNHIYLFRATLPINMYICTPDNTQLIQR